jgi:hypothetical protein
MKNARPHPMKNQAPKGKQKGKLQSSTSRQGQSRSSSDLSSDRIGFAWTSAIFLLHTLCLAMLFAPMSGLINREPIIEQDWGLHFHHLKSIEAFWLGDKSLCGYSPFFMAGYPANTIQDLSIKLFELASLGLATIALTPIQWFKLSAVFVMASIPWLLHFSARNFFAQDELKTICPPLAALFGTAYWWTCLPREMFFYGMIGFSGAAYLSIFGVSLFYRMANHPRIWSSTHGAWLLFALAIIPLHVQAVVILLSPAMALLIARPNLIRGRFLLWLIMPAALSLLANIAWLMPAFSHRHNDVSSAIVDQLPLFVSADPLTFVKDYLSPKGYWTFRPALWDKGFRLMLLILGSLGTVKLLRSRDSGLGIVFVTALISLFLLTYFGSLVPFLKGWQPLRFKVPFDLFLAIPAVYLVADWLTSRSSASRNPLVPVLLFAGAAAFLVNVLQTEARGQMRLRTHLASEVSAVVEWIAKETPENARVLFEESGDETGFVYDGMYLSSFVPYWTNRQLIGGPINLYNDRHHFAEFHSGKLFKKSIHTLSEEEIANSIRLYNIGAIVAFHPASIQRLQSMSGLVTLVKRVGPVHLMRVNQPFTWFLKGEGKIKASANRLELSEVRGDEVILKYHWTEGLIGQPSLKIVAIKIDEDPIPFIKIIDPPATFTLQISSRK